MRRPRRRTVAVGLAGIAAAGAVALALVLAADDDGPEGLEGPERLTDATGTISVVAPAGWDDTRLEPFPRDGGADLPRVEAAPDLAAYRDDLSAPGVEILYAPTLGAEHVADLLDETAERTEANRACNAGSGGAFQERGFEGEVAEFRDCPGGGSVWILAAVPPGGEGVLVANVQSATDAQRRTILDSLGLVD